MTTISRTQGSTNPIVLNLISIKGVIYGSLLIATAVLMPAIAHLTGAPIRILLPMHWPVILAGLVFGYRGGALLGILSPVVSYALSGLPYPPMLLPMTIELFTYGFLAGILVEKVRLNSFMSVFIALIFGRMAFLSVVSVFGVVSGSFYTYMKVALLPGIVAGIAQIILLPVLAQRWVERETKKGSNI